MKSKFLVAALGVAGVIGAGLAITYAVGKKVMEGVQDALSDMDDISVDPGHSDDVSSGRSVPCDPECCDGSGNIDESACETEAGEKESACDEACSEMRGEAPEEKLSSPGDVLRGLLEPAGFIDIKDKIVCPMGHFACGTLEDAIKIAEKLGAMIKVTMSGKVGIVIIGDKADLDTLAMRNSMSTAVKLRTVDLKPILFVMESQVFPKAKAEESAEASAE